MTDLHAIIFLIVAPTILASFLVLCDRVRS